MEKVKRFLSKHNETIHCLFVVYMVAYTILREVMLLQSVLCFDWMTTGLFVVGFLLVVWDLFTDRAFLKGRAIDLLVAFFAVCVISCIVNIRYGFAHNLKTLVTMLFEFFLLFSLGTHGDRKKRLHTLLNTLTVTLFIFVLLSIGMYLFSVDLSVISRHGSDQGFDATWGRLWGVFGDPNIIAYLGLISIFASGYFMYTYKKVWAYVLYGINVVVQLSFVVLSVSRSALVTLIVAPVVASLYPLIAYIKTNKIKAIRSMALTLLAGAVLFGGYFGLKQGLPYTKVALLRQVGVEGQQRVEDAYHDLYEFCYIEITEHKVSGLTEEDLNSEELKPLPSVPDKVDPTYEVEVIDRKDDKEDVSNGRFARWKAGFEVFMTTPIVGASPHNAVEIAKERTPDNVMGKHGWVAHCSYMEILFNSGILGAVILYGCLIYIAVRLIKRVANTPFDSMLYIAFVSFVTLAIGAFFVSDVFFILSVSAVLFYYLLGVLYDREEKTGLVAKFFDRLMRKRV